MDIIISDGAHMRAIDYIENTDQPNFIEMVIKSYIHILSLNI